VPGPYPVRTIALKPGEDGTRPKESGSFKVEIRSPIVRRVELPASAQEDQTLNLKKSTPGKQTAARMEIRCRSYVEHIRPSARRVGSPGSYVEHIRRSARRVGSPGSYVEHIRRSARRVGSPGSYVEHIRRSARRVGSARILCGTHKTRQSGIEPIAQSSARNLAGRFRDV